MDQLEIVQEEDTELLDNLFVPDVNSRDPEERKLARRIRIEKRIKAVARQHKGVEELRAERAAERVSLLQKQLLKSSSILHDLFREAEHQVTNVRVSNDRREMDRRERDKVRMGTIYGQLAEDARLAMQMFDEITSKWKTIMGHNDPLCIHEELQAQREKCDELLRQKDIIIALIKQEVRQAESRFFLDQRAQYTDIRLLAKRVENQVTLMRAAHTVELQFIEDVMIQERANMTENNDLRWNEMYKRHKERENAITEYKENQQRDFEITVSEARIKHYEKIRDVKITLERDCGELQKDFEMVKASALINTEKMDYNYQILKKREDENIIIKGNQKRLINKLQDTINILRTRVRDYEQKSKTRINRLCTDILNVQRNINHEKKNAKAIALANDTRYMEIWELNRRRADEILKKIMDIDKILSEQQLGIPWSPPHMKPAAKEKMPSYIAGTKFLEARYGKRLPPGVKLKKRKSILAAELTELEHNVGHRRLLQMVLEKLASKSDFLIDTGIKEIVSETSDREAVAVKVDSVLDALGINFERDIKVMLHYFRPYVYCAICSANKMEKYNNDNDDKDLSSNNTSRSGRVQERPTVGPTSPEIGANAVPELEILALEPMLNTAADDTAVDVIVSSIVDPNRTRGSATDLEIVRKQGECIGPTRMLAATEKKTQMVDTVTVFGDVVTDYCLVNHPLHMNPALIMRALRDFVSNDQCMSQTRNMELLSLPSDMNVAKTNYTLSRLLDKNDIRAYWKRYNEVLAERTVDLWNALSYGLKKYHMILEDRHRLNEELKRLYKQNQELRHLLKRFNAEVQTRAPCSVVPRSSILPDQYEDDVAKQQRPDDH